jgi:hypothetical protein
MAHLRLQGARTVQGDARRPPAGRCGNGGAADVEAAGSDDWRSALSSGRLLNFLFRYSKSDRDLQSTSRARTKRIESRNDAGIADLHQCLETEAASAYRGPA